MTWMQAPAMWRGTTVQVCGLWPFAAGAGSPSAGAPLGPNLLTGATVCADPVSWFRQAGLIANPSMFVVGRPGTGKSTLLVRMLIHLAATGVTPLVLGDLKPDYVPVVRWLGGQVIPVGRGTGGINILDPGAAGAAASRVGGQAGERLRAEAHGRALAMTAALVTLVRGQPVDDHEQAVLAAALHHLAGRHPASSPPVLPDLVAVLDAGPDRVRAVTLDRGSERRYRMAVDPLHRSLIGLLDGPLGTVFGSATTTRIDLDAPAVAVDISRIGEADAQLTAAAMLAAWSEGLGCVSACPRAGRRRPGPAALVLRGPGRAVAAAAGGRRADRPDRRDHPAEPGVGPGAGDDHPHPQGPRRHRLRGRPGQGPRVRRAGRDARLHGAAPLRDVTERRTT